MAKSSFSCKRRFIKTPGAKAKKSEKLGEITWSAEPQPLLDDSKF